MSITLQLPSTSYLAHGSLVTSPRSEEFNRSSVAYHEVSKAHHVAINEGDHLELRSTDDLPYRLLKNLGGGASANVELVQDLVSGKVYARKVFRNVHSWNLKKVHEQYLNEVKIMKRLKRHHHMIKIHASYKCGRDLAVILDPVADGGDLARFLQDIQDRGHGPSQGERQILFSSFGCLASGLDFMHQQTVRHKDIKPQNILIHQGRIIYTDFGISHDSSQLGSSTTAGNPQAFTRRYCAPEVADWAPRNSKADVFSLGCVFFEVLQVLEACVLQNLNLEDAFYQCHTELEASCLRVLKNPNAGSSESFILAKCILDMIQLDPEKRCHAKDVITRLRKFKDCSRFFCEDCITTQIPQQQPKPIFDIDAFLAYQTKPKHQTILHFVGTVKPEYSRTLGKLERRVSMRTGIPTHVISHDSYGWTPLSIAYEDGGFEAVRARHERHRSSKLSA